MEINKFYCDICSKEVSTIDELNNLVIVEIFGARKTYNQTCQNCAKKIDTIIKELKN